jgi:hypothetical protein
VENLRRKSSFGRNRRGKMISKHVFEKQILRLLFYLVAIVRDHCDELLGRVSNCQLLK